MSRSAPLFPPPPILPAAPPMLPPAPLPAAEPFNLRERNVLFLQGCVAGLFLSFPPASTVALCITALGTAGIMVAVESTLNERPHHPPTLRHFVEAFPTFASGAAVGRLFNSAISSLHRFLR